MTSSFHDLLPPMVADLLYKAGRHVSTPRGVMLMYPQQVGDSIHILRRGHVKISMPGTHGNETVLGFLGPGELVGEVAMADRKPRLGGVVAIEDVASVAVEATVFRSLMYQERSVCDAVILSLVSRLRDADGKCAEQSRDATARVASRLTELVERFGEPDPDGIRIALPITQAELASWTGSSVETIGRAVAALRDLGWISTRRRSIVVCNLPALTERARG